MLLAIDIGNTNIKLGVFSDGELKSSFRMTTKLNSTADEYGVYIKECLSSGGVKIKDIDDVIICSVIPIINYTFEHLCGYYFKKKPIFVTHELNTGLKIQYDNPSELGADRIVTSVAASRLYGEYSKGANTVPLIVVDFGTAMTFNVLKEGGVFLGGLIFPGIRTAADSLVRSTARLPSIELLKPKRTVAKNTIENVQSGLYFGFIGAAEYIIKRIKEEEGISEARVIATGGMSELIKGGSDILRIVDRKLSLLGLNLIYEMNKSK